MSFFICVEGDVNRVIELIVVDSELGYLIIDKGVKFFEIVVFLMSSISFI